MLDTQTQWDVHALAAKRAAQQSCVPGVEILALQGRLLEIGTASLECQRGSTKDCTWTVHRALHRRKWCHLKLIETLKPYLLREELRHTCPIDLETHEVKGLLAMRLLESSHLVKPCLDPSLAQATFVTVFDDWLPRRLLYLTESGSQSNIPIRLLVHLCAYPGMPHEP